VKNFSFFDLAQRVSESNRADALGEVFSISRRDFDERETFTFNSTAPCLEYACLLIENAVLLNTNRGGRIYAGFQKLSYMKPIQDRYLRIADVSESVFIFGEPDCGLPRHPNIRTIPLQADFQLTQEWFLIADSSSLRVAVIALEQTSANQSLISPETRMFSSLKTSDKNAVLKLATAAEGLIDRAIAV
jgi:DICT domain-containing protein